MAITNQVKSFYLHKCLDQSLFLMPEKALYWKEKNILLVADLHLGKAAHFRRSGIQIPESVHISDYFRMNRLIDRLQPTEIIFLGDVFHSDHNQAWDHFMEWIEKHAGISFKLVMGNHDILPEQQYYSGNLAIIKGTLQYPPFLFVHDLSHSIEKDDLFAIAGHIHPGVRLKGKAKQSLLLPCFYFAQKHAIIPAFGNFTGMAQIKPRENDHVFVILENSIIKLDN